MYYIDMYAYVCRLFAFMLLLLILADVIVGHVVGGVVLVLVFLPCFCLCSDLFIVILSCSCNLYFNDN